MSDMFSPYMQAVAAARSVLLSDEEALAGGTLLSLETTEESPTDRVSAWVEANLPLFMRALRCLPPDRQEVVLAYYLLGKSQNGLAALHKTTQTLVSSDLRDSVGTMGAYFMLGSINAETVRSVLDRANLDGVLADAIVLYTKSRSYDSVAARTGQQRTRLRRAMRNAQSTLSAHSDHECQALGFWLKVLIHQSSATGTGKAARHEYKHAQMYRVDPAILGAFRVSVTDPDFPAVFTARANLK
jgi:hypothetical protein